MPKYYTIVETLAQTKVIFEAENDQAAIRHVKMAAANNTLPDGVLTTDISENALAIYEICRGKEFDEESVIYEDEKCYDLVERMPGTKFAPKTN